MIDPRRAKRRFPISLSYRIVEHYQAIVHIEAINSETALALARRLSSQDLTWTRAPPVKSGIEFHLLSEPDEPNARAARDATIQQTRRETLARRRPS